MAHRPHLTLHSLGPASLVSTRNQCKDIRWTWPRVQQLLPRWLLAFLWNIVRLQYGKRRWFIMSVMYSFDKHPLSSCHGLPTIFHSWGTYTYCGLCTGTWKEIVLSQITSGFCVSWLLSPRDCAALWWWGHLHGVRFARASCRHHTTAVSVLPQRRHCTLRVQSWLLLAAFCLPLLRFGQTVLKLSHFFCMGVFRS